MLVLRAGFSLSPKFSDADVDLCSRKKNHCYPIEPEALHKILLQPRDGSDECDETRITAGCARLELDVSHNQVRQKRCPYLRRALRLLRSSLHSPNPTPSVRVHS